MKNPVVINLNDGLYFHNGDDKVYFVEKNISINQMILYNSL